jgi:hypothetical protein
MYVIMKPTPSGLHEYFLTVDALTDEAIWKQEINEGAKYATRQEAERALNLLKEWRDAEYEVVEI